MHEDIFIRAKLISRGENCVNVSVGSDNDRNPVEFAIDPIGDDGKLNYIEVADFEVLAGLGRKLRADLPATFEVWYDAQPDKEEHHPAVAITWGRRVWDLFRAVR